MQTNNILVDKFNNDTNSATASQICFRYGNYINWKLRTRYERVKKNMSFLEII